MNFYRIFTLVVGGVLISLFSACKTVESTETDVVLPIIDYTVKIDSYDSMKKEVKKFDGLGQYETSYNIIETYLKQDTSQKVIAFALWHANEHYKLLNNNNKIFNVSLFVEPKVYNAKRREQAETQKFPQFEKAKSLQILEQYDLLKKNMTFYQKIIKDYPLQGTPEEKKVYLKLQDHIKSIRERTWRARGLFVSYSVVSPAIAEASKQLYIATIGWNDKKKIKEIVVNLNHKFHTNWLLFSYEDVRIQFAELWKEIKNSVGEDEFEHLKTLTTLLDSNDPSKEIGPSAWWPEK